MTRNKVKISFKGLNRIAVIKAFRYILSIGLKEAKDCVDLFYTASLHNTTMLLSDDQLGRLVIYIGSTANNMKNFRDYDTLVVYQREMTLESSTLAEIRKNNTKSIMDYYDPDVPVEVREEEVVEVPLF